MIIFLSGLVVRLYDLSDPPLDFHPNRQLHSALIARGMYYETLMDVPAWQREAAVDHWQMEGHIEPQTFERVVSWVYRLVGGADLRIPRVIAIVAWMVAALFITWLAVDLAGLAGALVAACFFLAWPYGVIASRAFQPEPIALMLAAIALWAGVRWEQRGGWGCAIAAGLFAGLSIYTKVVMVFVLGPSLLVLVLARNGVRRFPGPQVWLMAVLAVLPYAAYHVNGVYIEGFLVSQFGQRFFPQMWLDSAFYLRWLSNLGRVLPFEMSLAALIGAFLIKKPAHRALLLAWWAGYFAYGMALSHHISTHDYYHLLLFPALALGLAGLGEIVFNHLAVPDRWAKVVAVTAVLALLTINIYAARTTLKRFDGATQAQAWQQIGEKLGQDALVVALVPDYGVGLKYWGWINPLIWPTLDDIRYRQSLGEQIEFSSLFESVVVGRQFFVITQFDDLEQQPELKSYLFEHYPVYQQSPGYLIFDLRVETEK